MDWKKIGKKIIFPPIRLLIAFTVISAAALVFVFAKGLSNSAVAYVSYVFAFYTLSAVCAFIWKVLPKRYRIIRQKIYSHPFGHRYMTDAAFRTHISLYFSLGVSVLYAGVNALSFVLYRSMWFVILAGYYIILAVMRFVLVRYVRKNGIGQNRIGELKSATLCSSILLTVNFVLSGAVLMILFQDRGFEYHGIMIYVMAAYTFYITTHAIINLIKYRKYNSHVMMITKIIALSAALVSMLALETAMFSQFGQNMPQESQRLMIILTGAGVSITVIALSVYMIIQCAKEMNRLRNNNYGKQR